MKMLTLSQLCDWFEERREFKALAPASQRSYLHHIDSLLMIMDEDQVAGGISAEQVDNAYERAERRYGKHAAVSMCRVAKRMFNLAVRYDTKTGVSKNPFSKMGLPGLDKRTVVWTEEEIWEFWKKAAQIKKRPVGLLAMLCYVFAQRPVDMRKLKWANVRNGTLITTTQKTGVVVRLFIPDFMQTILDETPRKGPYVVSKDDGTPFDNRLYNYWAYDVKKAAHIPLELKLADLRKTAFTEMGDSEATDQELLSFGHMNREELTTYTLRSVAQSKKAMEKRFKKR